MDQILDFYKKKVSEKVLKTRLLRVYEYAQWLLAILFLGFSLFLMVMYWFRSTANSSDAVLTLWLIGLSGVSYAIFWMVHSKWVILRKVILENATQCNVYNYYEDLRRYQLSELRNHLTRERIYDDHAISGIIQRIDNLVTRNMISSQREVNVFYWLTAVLSATYITKTIEGHPEAINELLAFLRLETSKVDTIVVLIMLLFIYCLLKLFEIYINKVFHDREEHVWKFQRHSDEGKVIRLLEELFTECLVTHEFNEKRPS